MSRDHCPGCGGHADEGEHEACARLLAYDPPRFCRRCGARLDVQVFPGGYRAACRACRRRRRAALPAAARR